MLQKKIETTFIRTYKSLNLPQNIKLGIAYSGGPDSTLLLYLFDKLKDYLKIKDIYILYFNHLLRGKESEEEEMFVKNVAKLYNYPLIIGYPKIHPPKGNIENWARAERYKFFESMKRELNLDYIALGHNLSDLTETIILNFIKGSFLEGLKGFLPKRDFYIRPLIEISKSDIEKYLNEKNIKYFIDSSNLKTNYERNYLRHKIIPLLKNLNPSLEKTLLNFAKNMWDLNEYWKKHIDKLFLNYFKKRPKELEYLDRKTLLKLPNFLVRELIQKYLKEKYNFILSSKDLFEIENIIKKYKNFQRDFGKLVLKIEDNKLFFKLSK